jgi:hypothetical protein
MEVRSGKWMISRGGGVVGMKERRENSLYGLERR